jgi:1-deoxy-D-xylulose 5-phosphate reductoisomerase
VKEIVYQVSHHSSVIDRYEKASSEINSLLLENEKKKADILSAERELMELKIVQQKQQMEQERLTNEQERLTKLYQFLSENGQKKEANQVMKKIIGLAGLNSTVE